MKKKQINYLEKATKDLLRSCEVKVYKFKL